jgi:VanZ family protein
VNHKLLLKYLFVIIWMVLIFAFSSQGHDVSSGQSEGVVAAIQQATGLTLPETIVRKMAHILLYATLGILAALLVREYTRPGWRLVLSAEIIVILYATSDEIHQLFIPGRSGEMRDVLIDSTAGLVGITIATLLYHHYLLHKKQ